MDEAIPLRSPNRFETVKLSATPKEKAPAMVRLHNEKKHVLEYTLRVDSISGKSKSRLLESYLV